MSAPAAKAFSPAPVMMIARMSALRSSSSSANESSPSSLVLSALSTLGRLSVTMPSGPSLSTSMFSKIASLVVIEPLPVLAAEAAREHHPFEQGRRSHHRILELVVHDLRDIIRRIQSHEIEQFQGPHRIAAAQLHAFVDVFFARKAAFVATNRVEQIRNKKPVDDKTRGILGQNRLFPEFPREGEERVDHVLRGRDRFYHLDQLHDRYGVEEVQPGDAVR